ncbi:hypothetical protein KM043_006259 [Ampulex compressa]|nr:hypothetical protein KM043_006259 [Ampulex compressa]
MKTCLLLAIVALTRQVFTDTIDPAIPCKTTEDCLALQKMPQNANCKNGFCACSNSGKVVNCSSVEILWSDNKGRGPLVFRTCKHDQECHLQYGFCNTTISQCECQKDYVPSSNKQRCLPKARSIDFPCTDEKQCLAFLPNTTCHNGQCSCAAGYHYVNDTCWNTVDFGERCTMSEECSHIEDAICTKEKICGCGPKAVINMNGRRCLRVARAMNEHCTENVQCSTAFFDSRCIEKTCQCREKYHFEANVERCYRNKALDNECESSYECYQEGNQTEGRSAKPLQCIDKTCVCADNHYRKENTCISAGTPFVAPSRTILLLFTIACFVLSRDL